MCTHYFPQTRDFTNVEWELITNDTRQIIDSQVKKLICGSNGEGKAAVTSEEIWFNGNKDDNQSHEPFHITKHHNEKFNFCKTARKSYDAVVVAALCVCHHYAPGALDIGLDGSEEDWQQGLAMAQKFDKDVLSPVTA